MVKLEILVYYRCERIIEDIALFAQDIFLSQASQVDREQAYQYFMAMFELNGVVDIAIK